METRSTWTDLIAGVGVDIAEVFDEGQELYISGLQNVVRADTGEGGLGILGLLISGDKGNPKVRNYGNPLQAKV